MLKGASMTSLDDAAQEREQIFLRCERFLFGHGPQRPRAVLADLVDEAGPDEEPDRYGEGSLINDFERDIAALLGKEAAVFLPSGTMAQQIALRIWAGRAGNQTVAFHPTCHLEIHEQKGYELLHGLHGRLVGERSRLITLDDLRATPGPRAPGPRRGAAPGAPTARDRRATPVVVGPGGASCLGARPGSGGAHGWRPPL